MLAARRAGNGTKNTRSLQSGYFIVTDFELTQSVTTRDLCVADGTAASAAADAEELHRTVDCFQRVGSQAQARRAVSMERYVHLVLVVEVDDRPIWLFAQLAGAALPSLQQA